MALGARVRLGAAVAGATLAVAWVLSRSPGLSATDASRVAAKLAALRAARDAVERTPVERDGASAGVVVPLVIGDPAAGSVNAVALRDGTEMGFDGGCLESLSTSRASPAPACVDLGARRLRYAVLVAELERTRGESGTMGSFDVSPTRPVFAVAVVDLESAATLRRFLFQASTHREEGSSEEERARHARVTLEEALSRRVEGARFAPADGGPAR